MNLNNVPKWLIWVVIAALMLAAGVYAWQRIADAEERARQVVQAPPQVIHTKTETIREVAVQAPSQPGAVLQFVEREGKMIAIVNGKKVEVPNLTGKPEIKLGESGELRIESTNTAKIDVTEMANAQARLIANQELEKQAKIHKQELDKEKSARKRERAWWIIATAAGVYLMTR